MNALILFCATAGLVFALGLQSLNVNGRHFIAAGLTSFMIGGANLVLFKTLPGPTSGLELAGYLCGGPIGILAAMVLHPRMVKAWEALAKWRQTRPTVCALQARHQPAVHMEVTAPELFDADDFAGWLTGMERTFVWACIATAMAAWAALVIIGLHVWGRP